MQVHKILGLFLVLFLSVEIGYTFFQYYHATLDGDLAPIVVPSDHYKAVMDSPFGLKAVVKDTSYAATNRHYVHIAMYHYFRAVPAAWRTIADPVQSIYLSTASFKMLIHLLLLMMLSFYAAGSDFFWSKKGLLLLGLIAPLFQSGGSYYNLMGVIGQSPTYAFFYAAPMAVLLVFYFPVYRALVWGKRLNIKWWQWIGIYGLAIILPFSGPLIPAVVMVVSASAFAVYWFFIKIKWQALLKVLPLTYWGAIVIFNVLSLYSLYLGGYNAEQSLEMELGARYQLLLEGIIHQFTNKLGPILLLLMIVINVGALLRLPSQKKGETIKLMLKWIFIFTLIYLFLLPFGGYRSYRPLIVRRDTLLPVFLLLFFFWGISTTYILGHLKQNARKLYLIFIVATLALFQLADEPQFEANKCERTALEKLQQSEAQTVIISDACKVLAWDKIETVGQSEVQSKLLKIWKVLSEDQSYYQSKNVDQAKE